MRRKNKHGFDYYWRDLSSKLLYSISFMLPPRFYTLKYEGGVIRLPLRDSYRMWAKLFGSYEYEKTGFVREYLQKGKVVIDAGANVGYFTWLFASLVGPKGHVYAVEPSPELIEELVRTLQLAPRENVTLVPHALGETPGQGTFYYGKLTGWGSLHYSKSHAGDLGVTIAVTVKTVDQLVDEYSIKHVDLIKIDVEDGDLAVLKGATRTLEKFSPDVLIDIDFRDPQMKHQVWDFLASKGYRFSQFGKMMPPLDAIPENSKDLFATKAERTNGDHAEQ